MKIWHDIKGAKMKCTF